MRAKEEGIEQRRQLEAAVPFERALQLEAAAAQLSAQVRCSRVFGGNHGGTIVLADMCRIVIRLRQNTQKHRDSGSSIRRDFSTMFVCW